MTSNTTPQHIMILGISERSGTNFLYSLLKLHQDVTPMSFSGEDFLLHSSKNIARYVFETSQNWHQKWGGGINISDFQQQLFRSVGKGLLNEFLTPTDGAQTSHILSKTPDTQGVEWAHSLLPSSRIIFLTRNPTSTIESGRKSFGWSYQQGVKRWRSSARRILEMTNRFPDNTLIVKYEDLILQQEAELNRIMEFASLPPEKYQFDKLKDLKILGSSRIRKSDGTLTWEGDASEGTQTKLNPSHEVPSWLQNTLVLKCKTEYKSLGYPSLNLRLSTIISDQIKFLVLTLPDMMKFWGRKVKRLITFPIDPFTKWCKNQLGLEIETPH